MSGATDNQFPGLPNLHRRLAGAAYLPVVSNQRRPEGIYAAGMGKPFRQSAPSHAARREKGNSGNRQLFSGCAA